MGSRSHIERRQKAGERGEGLNVANPRPTPPSARSSSWFGFQTYGLVCGRPGRGNEQQTGRGFVVPLETITRKVDGCRLLVDLGRAERGLVGWGGGGMAVRLGVRGVVGVMAVRLGVSGVAGLR